MRLIDADALIENLHKDPLYDLVGRYGIDGVIESMPTEEEIVRCKDCKWNRTPECPMAETTVEDIAGIIETGVGDCYNRQDDYCSYGERKE